MYNQFVVLAHYLASKPLTIAPDPNDPKSENKFTINRAGQTLTVRLDNPSCIRITAEHGALTEVFRIERESPDTVKMFSIRHPENRIFVDQLGDHIDAILTSLSLQAA